MKPTENHTDESKYFRLFIMITWRNRDSAVGMETGYGLDDREVGIRIPVRSKIFSSLRLPDRFWAHPTFYPMGTDSFFPGVKRPRPEADHLPPSSAEVKKTWIYTSTPPYVFMGKLENLRSLHPVVYHDWWYLAVNTTINKNKPIECSHWFYLMVVTCFCPNMGPSSGSCRWLHVLCDCDE
jgi:hypothetical protein